MTLSALLTLSVADAQIANAGFEQWDTVLSAYYPTDWPLLGTTIMQRTTDAHSGNYALEVSVWYYYTDTKAEQVAPINYRPEAFCGWYKYTDNIIKNQTTNLVTEDTAFASVYLTKWNTVTNTSDTIGRGQIHLLGSNSYQHFTCPVTYTSAEMPDTVFISMDPSMMRNGGTYFSTDSTGYNSYLKIDDLYLQRWATGVTKLSGMEMKAWPNPASDVLNVVMSDAKDMIYTITDLTGKVAVHSMLRNGSARINLSALPAGPYILSVYDDQNTIATQTFIRQ